MITLNAERARPDVIAVRVHNLAGSWHARPRSRSRTALADEGRAASGALRREGERAGAPLVGRSRSVRAGATAAEFRAGGRALPRASGRRRDR